jgi:glutamine amidotransferase
LIEIAIIDYGLGNLGSVQNMLRKAGAVSVLVNDPDQLDRYPAVILPGVGAFDAGAKKLAEQGFDDALKQYVANESGLLLGICLGMQLLMDSSEEGECLGLGFIPGQVSHFIFSEELASQNLKIPHMGWNELKVISDTPLLEGLDDRARFYFVHSYHAVCSCADHVLASANYGYEFTCMIGKDNVFGAQFHPEKSHRFGLHLFKNYIKMVEANHAS